MKKIIILALILLGVSCENIYKHVDYKVTSLGKNNWDNQVISKRSIGYSVIVHFYKASGKPW
jgi:hypothetical protein